MIEWEGKERDLVRLQHMNKAIQFIEQFCEGKSFENFEKDDFFQSAVVRQFEILGEASKGLSERIKRKYPDVKWREMQRFRNFLAHEYFRIDAAQVWQTIEYDLPEVKIQIRTIIQDIKPPEESFGDK